MKWYYLLGIIALTVVVTTMVVNAANKAKKCPEGKTWDEATKTCK